MEEKSLQPLVAELGFNDLPEKEKKELEVSLAEALLSCVTKRIMLILTEEQKQEFDKLSEKESSDKEVFEFLSAKIPNFEEIFADEYLKFRAEMLESNKRAEEMYTNYYKETNKPLPNNQ